MINTPPPRPTLDDKIRAMLDRHSSGAIAVRDLALAMYAEGLSDGMLIERDACARVADRLARAAVETSQSRNVITVLEGCAKLIREREREL